MTDKAQALAGLKVVELGSDLPTAWCGRQFALWGADVVVLEPPGGSPLRRSAPRLSTETGEVSLLWEYVAAAKRSLRVPRDQAALLDLLATADVVLVDGADGGLTRWATSPSELRAAFPELVIVYGTAWGVTGPQAGLATSELVVQAFAGYVDLNGEAGRAPLKAPAHILALACGVSAFVAALAFVIKRLKGGGGGLVETSELETIASLLPLLRGQYTGTHQGRAGGPATGARLLPCRDGFVCFMPPTPAQLDDYGAVLDIASDTWPSCAHDPAAPARAAELGAFLARHTRPKPAEAVFLGLLRKGHACGRVASPRDILDDAHLTARGFFEPVAHPVLGSIAMPGAAARLSRTPAAGFAPAPGRPVEGRTDHPGWTEPRAGDALAAGRMPLQGITVLDLTQAWIGPYAAMLLADLGAEVIKIESHRRPDVWRQLSANPVALTKLRAREVNGSPNYNSVNCNKRSLCLNFKTVAGRALFLRLAEQADVVMENFTPRVMERFELDYATISKVNPRVVVSSFSGFGKTGPLSDFKANGTTVEGIGGWDHFHHYAGEDPILMGFYQADPITGLQMAATTLVAMVHQARTGEGQAIDGSMYEAAAGYIGEALLDAQFGLEQTPPGNRSPDAAPNGVYPCAGEDRWIAISALDDLQWQALVTVVPALADARFSTQTGRVSAQDDLDAVLATWTQAQDATAAMARLQAVGVPAAVVRSSAEVLDCPQLAALGWFRPLRHADVGEHHYNGPPWRFVGIDPGESRPPPRLGEHTRAILREHLAISDVQIDELIATDATGALLADPD